jgi:hypothetical protein
MTRSTPRPPGYVAGTWTIDSARSTVAFTIRHLLIHKVRGRFGAFTGQIVTGDEVTRSSVSAQIDLDSLDTGDAGSDNGTVSQGPVRHRLPPGDGLPLHREWLTQKASDDPVSAALGG